MVLSIATLGLLTAAGSLWALDNGVARTPPMGWNSWNKFACNVSEELIQRDRRRDGVERHEGRRLPVREHRRLLAGRARRAAAISSPMPKHFRRGMKALADYVHAQGSEARHLLRRRHGDLRRTVPAAAATSFRTR